MSTFVSFWSRYPLWVRILFALILGIVVGIALPSVAVHLKILGDLFIRLIRMLILPLIFITIISGIVSIESGKGVLGKILGGSVALYLATSFFAISVGLIVATVSPLPTGLSLPLSDAASDARTAPAFSEVFLNLFPSNIAASMSNGNIIQVIVFAVFLGMAIKLSGSHGVRISKLFADANIIIMLLTKWIIELAPFGVFGLISYTVATQGAAELLGLAGLVGVAFLAYAVHTLVTIGLLVHFAGGISVIRFFSGVRDAMIVSFSTASSSGTIPVSMRNVRENLNVPDHVSGIVMPLGATVNMDGTSVFMGVCTVFLAGVYGVDLSMSDYVLIVVTGVLASIGTAGVPGAGVIMLGTVLTAVGLPVEGVLIILGVERILDMGRTSVNVMGDCAVSRIISFRFKTFASEQEGYSSDDVGVVAVNSEQAARDHEAVVRSKG